MSKRYSAEFMARLKAVKGKRSRVVVDHILKHGEISTDKLKTKYGYDHPPRAIRDVLEQGIALERFWVKGPNDRRIAAYRFDLTKPINEILAGRRIFSKSFKQALYATSEGKCAICGQRFESRYLQIDHRVPYEVAGDSGAERRLEEYMLLCGSCNRAKSWSCEHCPNWTEKSVRCAKRVTGRSRHRTGISR